MKERVAETASYIYKFFSLNQPVNWNTSQEILDKNLPYWVSQLASIYHITLNDIPCILVMAKENISVDQGAKLHKVISGIFNRIVILMADRLPKKGRGTLVRLKIPHVVKDEVVYIPSVGVKYGPISEASQALKTIYSTLSFLALKIAAIYLVKPELVLKEWSLSEWGKYFHIPLSSLSRAFSQLIQFNLVHFVNDKASKKMTFRAPEIVWHGLVNSSPHFISKYLAVEKKPEGVFAEYYKISGESALSKFSDLNESKRETIAISSIHWTLWSRSKDAPFVCEAERGIKVEIWEGSGSGFGFGFNSSFVDPDCLNCVNPILLALSLKKETDPRIKTAITEMLHKFNLDASFMWRER